MKNRLILSLLLSTTLAACIPASAPETGSSNPAAGAVESADFTRFRDGFFEEYFRQDPAFAIYQGRHEYDGRLPDWSEAGLQRTGDFLR